MDIRIVIIGINSATMVENIKLSYFGKTITAKFGWILIPTIVHWTKVVLWILMYWLQLFRVQRTCLRLLKQYTKIHYLSQAIWYLWLKVYLEINSLFSSQSWSWASQVPYHRDSARLSKTLNSNTSILLDFLKKNLSKHYPIWYSDLND